MNIHKNARLTPHGRADCARVLDRGRRRRPWPRPSALRRGRSQMGRALPGGGPGGPAGPFLAAAPALSPDTGRVGRTDRGAAPAALDRPADRRRARPLAGHRQPCSQTPRAEQAQSPGAGRAGAPLRARAPGELIHIDIKKLGRFNRVGHRITGDRTGRNSRGVGWEFVHVCIDDHSRVAFTQILPDEKEASAVTFLKAAVAYYQSLGVTIQRVMTDNGSCYKSFASQSLRGSVSGTSAPSPTRQRPTARPSASSRPRSGSGPTPRPIPAQIIAPPSCPGGCIDTTGIGHMAG